MYKLIALASFCFLAACQEASSPVVSDPPRDSTFDVVLSGGTVVDGLGNPRFNASIGIRGEHIVVISDSGLAGVDAKEVIDVSGLIVAPGFIDNHAHIQTSIHEHPLATELSLPRLDDVSVQLGSEGADRDALSS